ncbi:MAG: sulfatase-like hydrolase/transferase [Lentisphaeria bacterium]|nr:sulfatase-like hydrolase/transferase [Lentisphaeria bacterium]
MASKRPNICFFFTDDQRFDTLSALGNRVVATPNMDRLVREGVAFTQAHIPCGTSGAVCMPSRAMLHSGRTLFHLQGAGEGIPPEHTTLGEAFRASGYCTFGTGKWHNGPAAYQRSFGAGDEIFFGGMADHWNVPAYHYDPSGRYDRTCPWIENWQTDNTVKQRRCDHVHAGKHSSELIAEAALRFLDSRQAGDRDPFLLYLSFLAPHDPRSMPREYLDRYDPAAIVLPPNFAAGHAFDTGALQIRDEKLAGFPRTPAEIRRHMAEYYAMITHLDAQIGRVLARFDALGLTGDTLFVLAGDNGLAVGQHGLMGKQNCYDHSVRVPLVISGAGVTPGVRCDAYVYLLDLFPTLCEVAGIAIPSSVEGASFAPALTGGEACGRETLYFAYTDLQRAVKDRRYKLIEYVVGGRHTATQLFDLQEDPWETRDLSALPEQRSRLAGLRQELLAWRERWDDAASPWGQRYWAGMPQ